jgi:hypothetical protein
MDGEPSRDPPRKLPERLRDVGNAPVQQLPDRRFRHREKREVRSLAHVEAARIRLERLVIVGQPLEIARSGARDPALLKRRPCW